MMSKRFQNLSLFFSILIGVLGIILLSLNFLYLWWRIPEIPLEIKEKLPFFLGSLINILRFFAFLFFFLLSPLAIFLATKSLKAQRKLAIFTIILNTINLIISVFIGWLVYGLATGAM